MSGSTAAAPTTQPIDAQPADDSGGRSVWFWILSALIVCAVGAGIFFASRHFGQEAVNVIFMALLVAMLLDRCQLANHIDEARAEADEARDDAAKARSNSAYAYDEAARANFRIDGIVAHLNGQEVPGGGRHAKGSR